MRTFIAIEFPQEIKEYLGRIQSKLKISQADVKWVAPSNIHLTLKFLGEIDEQKKNAVIQAMQTTCSQHKPFSMTLGPAGGFPTITSPRVIWIGAAQGDPEIKTLAKNLEKELVRIGFPAEDREFSSHITLGRTRSSKNRQQLTATLQDLNTKPLAAPATIPVQEIILFKSTLTPQGSIYEKIVGIPLTKKIS